MRWDPCCRCPYLPVKSPIIRQGPVTMMHPSRITGVKKREEVFRGIIVFGISPMTTEFVHRPRCALLEGSFTRFAHFLALSRERVPCHQTLRRNTSTVLQNTMAVRGTCKQVSGSLRSFVLHKPSIDSHTDHASPRPIVASMKLS